MLHLHSDLREFDHIIWDLNGTLIDDAELCVRAVNPLLREYGLSEIDLVRYQQAFRFPVSEYYVDLGFRLTPEEFEALSHRFHDHYHRLVPEARLFEGTQELLGRLKEDGKRLSILTAAWHQDLERLVRHFAIESYFDHFFGLHHRQADSKIQRGRELLAASGLAREKTILLGDTLHDLEVAEALGIQALLLTGGHMSEERLLRSSARVIRR
jgi:phosphoglycolate phosphatase